MRPLEYTLFFLHLSSTSDASFIFVADYISDLTPMKMADEVHMVSQPRLQICLRL